MVEQPKRIKDVYKLVKGPWYRWAFDSIGMRDSV
jgi:hypothetical protein